MLVTNLALKISGRLDVWNLIENWDFRNGFGDLLSELADDESCMKCTEANGWSASAVATSCGFLTWT